MESNKIWKRLYDSNNTLVYEGDTLNGKPYGKGTSYFSNGAVYQEGVFDVKGLVSGREYFPNGYLRFEGTYCIHKGYGPNYPLSGKCYNQKGALIYEGRIKVRFGGVGYPMVQVPADYGSIPQKGPHIDYFTWEDVRTLGMATGYGIT